jgi:hypothetical protein
MFTGYIDDSGSKKSHLLTLSCLVGHGSQWFWFENEWLKCLQKKNKQLKSQERRQLSRYHAADCSSCFREFKGWTPEEQIDFVKCLIRVFQRHPLVISSYTLDIRDLIAEFPEAEKEPYGLAHILLFNHIMKYVAEKILGDPRWTTDRLAFVHDRGAYDAVLAEAFGHMKNDGSLLHHERFTTITAMGWQDCVPLQAADLLAYENFRCVERETAGYKRRKALELILDLDSIGGRGAKIQRQGFKEIRDKLDDESRRILFANSRISRGIASRRTF